MKKIYILIITLFIIGLLGKTKAQTTVVFYTTEGAFVVELHDTLMPITVGNFLKLTNENFYDGVIFHRVVSNFVIQTGDPTGTGSGGPGYTIQDEFDSTLSNTKGTLGMANTGQPNSGGSQFYINLKDNTFLDFDKAPLTSKHPVFGFVLHNYFVVDNIGKVAVDANDRPITPVTIDSLRVFSAFMPTDLEPDIGKNFGMKVYPNPIDAESVVAINARNRSGISLSVIDQNGRQLAAREWTVEAGINQLPVAELISETPATGVYYLVAEDGEMKMQKRMIVR